MIQTYCAMCKDTLATRLCWDSRCEAYCDKHFAMMHGKQRWKENSSSSHINVIDI